MGEILSKKILGTRVDFGLSYDDVLSRVEQLLDSSDSFSLESAFGHYICTTNPEFVLEAYRDPEFQDIINNAMLSVPDGVGVIMAGKYLDRISTLPQNAFFPVRALVTGISVGFSTLFSFKDIRVTGVELTHCLCGLAAAKGYTVGLIGGWPKDFFGHMKETDIDVASIAADKLKNQFPNLNIVFSSSQFSFSEKDDSEALSYCTNSMQKKDISSIDLLFVAYGQKKQEFWIERNSAKLNAKVSIGVGGTFDYLSGLSSYSSSVVKKLNIEWLFRLITQPWRIGRIVSAVLIFPYLVFKNSLRNS